MCCKNYNTFFTPNFNILYNAEGLDTMCKAEMKLEDIGVSKEKKQTTITYFFILFFLISSSAVLKFNVVLYVYKI